MTLQQLKYIIAIDKYKNFANAAKALDVTQPTISGMLIKLEEELDVRIFERTNKTVSTTAIGRTIIRQAEKVLMETERINELVHEEKGKISGKLLLTIGPTIAPYILPKFIRHYRESYPQVNIGISEMKAEDMLKALEQGKIEAGIAISGNARSGIMEIPLYTERFFVYLAESCWRKLPVFKPENLEHESMWIMKEAQCLRNSAFSFCKARTKGHHIYEAGSIETLTRIVDENGGFTIIPEMHLPFLSEKQRKNVCPIDGDHLSQRCISLYIKEDFIRQGILNTITQTLIRFMPKGMLEERIIKYGIKL